METNNFVERREGRIREGRKRKISQDEPKTKQDEPKTKSKKRKTGDLDTFDINFFDPGSDLDLDRELLKALLSEDETPPPPDISFEVPEDIFSYKKDKGDGRIKRSKSKSRRRSKSKSRRRIKKSKSKSRRRKSKTRRKSSRRKRL